MNVLKVIAAAAFTLAPAVASADAIAVAMGAQFQHVQRTTTFTTTHEGAITIPELTVESNGNVGVDLGWLGTYDVSVTGLMGSTEPAEGTYSGSTTHSITATRAELTSVSVAAAAGRSAVASASTNAWGSTTANAGASDARGASLTASGTSRFGAYASEVNVRENSRRR